MTTDKNNQKKIGARTIKKQISGFLLYPDFQKTIDNICKFPEQQLIGPLFSHFYNKEELIRWRAVTIMGIVVSRIAESGNMESARIVMRRLMWNLNDESGGIGWGSPEAMGEILSRNQALAREYHSILTSYVSEHGNFLEHEILQRGVLWGIGRLAHEQPDLIRHAAPDLIPFLKSHDPLHRGLAAWGCTALKHPSADLPLRELADDNTKIKIFLNQELVECSVSLLAAGQEI
ncbi:HEAT repeat domain-containing protein [Desulfonema limicola]|uniref:HEAT repeat domain-containing protein n=1 Tax=Desulfonema limicola TaxID=45656 RepID=A0A975GFJ1_9BACT|nr:DVU0298 family protein [Desulfonema limicola]QTA79245.1 HEAT repeat domain-containing protein [Desulfonema limicola]